MDIRLQGNSQPHYGINGGAGQNSRPGEKDALQFLSQEEQECIQFFEDTIDSLEDSLEEDNRRPAQVKPYEISSISQIEEVIRSPSLSPNPAVTMYSHLASPPSPKDQDIIDLVRPEPDLVQTKEPILSPTNPDFQSMMLNPESHFEIKPRRDPLDSLPSEYNPPLPSGSYGPTDSHSSYHPPGCIPTPVLIAQKIAENQPGGTSHLLPSSLLRRSSLESEKTQSYSADLPVKHGPPTSAKPNRFPANISVILGNKEHQNQSLANVSIHERRAQMLANLAGTSHPLLQENSQQTTEQRTQNTPTRSISFRDPTPDKSRIEALSKLGLSRNRAMSGGVSQLDTTDSTLPDRLTDVDTSDKSPVASPTPTTKRSSKLLETNFTAPPLSEIHVDRKPEPLRRDSVRSHEDRSPQPSLSPTSRYNPPPLEDKGFPPPPPEVTTLEFNSYGGKSIVVNPTVFSKNEPPISPSSPEPKSIPPALSHPSEFNSYGGKSKVMTPVPAAMSRSDLPDILSSHIDKSQRMPARSEPLPLELNSYGGKSRSINPTVGSARPSDSPSKSFKAPAPTPAPRPPRPSNHAATPQKPASRALSPEHNQRSNSLFRPQSITVQFSGRGATNESRREALKKLGLLKDS